MEQKNNVVISIDCSSTSKFSNLLLEALQICNSELAVEKNNILQFESKLTDEKRRLSDEEDAHTKTKGELDKEKDAHAKTKDELDKEKDAHSKTKDELDKEKDAHSKTKDELDKEKDAHAKTKDELDKEKDAHAKTKDELDKEKDAHTKTKDELDKEKDAHTKTKDELDKEKDAHTETKGKLDQISENGINNIKFIFNNIAEILEDNIGNEPLSKYVESIIKKDSDGKFAWSGCNNIEEFLYKCKFATSFFSRIANLIWWNEQEELKPVTACIPRINDLRPLVENVVSILSVFEHKIQFPKGPMALSLRNYSRYENERSNFMSIFTSEKLETGTLCEIRQLAIDGLEGQLFIYYK